MKGLQDPWYCSLLDLLEVFGGYCFIYRRTVFVILSGQQTAPGGEISSSETRIKMTGSSQAVTYIPG